MELVDDFTRKIYSEIEYELQNGKKKFAIYTYGTYGRMVEKILGEKFAIKPVCIIDNKVYDGNQILSLKQAKNCIDSNTYILICTDNPECYEEVRNMVYSFFPEEKIIDLFGIRYSETEIIKRMIGIDKDLEKLDEN